MSAVPDRSSIAPVVADVVVVCGRTGGAVRDRAVRLGGSLRLRSVARGRFTSRRLPPRGAGVRGSRRCARGRPSSVDTDRAGCPGRIRGCYGCGVVRAAARRPATGTCLVFRAVLARVRVFLRIQRPVRARGRAIPRGAAPVRIERLGVDVVVRRRTERRLLGTLVRTGPLGRARRASRARRRARPRSGCGARPLTRPATVGAMGRAGPVGIGLPRARTGRAVDRSAYAGVRTGDLVVCRLDGEELGQRGLTRGVRMVRLGQPAVRPLDLGEGHPSLEAERAVRIRIESHGWLALLGSLLRARVPAFRWDAAVSRSVRRRARVRTPGWILRPLGRGGRRWSAGGSG